MLGRTFRTIKNNPKILLLFAAMYLVPIAIFLVAILSLFPSMSNLESSFMNDDPVFLSKFFMIYSAIMGSSFILGITMVVLVIPPVFNYIYEACAGINTEGWYKRGLKRSWWKLLVLFIIYTAVLTPLMFGFMFVMMLLERLFWIVMILMYVIMMAIAVYMMIAMAAVIAEDDFGKALGNTFTLGSKFFFKMLGTIILIMLPSFVLSGVFSTVQMQGFMTDSFNIVSYIISMLFAFIYGMLAYAYLYTYTMNSYLNEKGVFNAPLMDEEIVTEQSFEIASDSDIDRVDR